MKERLSKAARRRSCEVFRLADGLRRRQALDVEMALLDGRRKNKILTESLFTSYPSLPHAPCLPNRHSQQWDTKVLSKVVDAGR
jgi:hypothetical protein